MKKNLIGLLLLFGLALGMSLPAAAQETQSDSGRLSRIPAGQKQKLRGVIVKREADSFILRDLNGVDVQVNLSNITKVEEKKGNPFRRAKDYGTTSLLRGLSVEVDGRGEASGALLADKIRMRDYELVAARLRIDSRRPRLTPSGCRANSKNCPPSPTQLVAARRPLRKRLTRPSPPSKRQTSALTASLPASMNMRRSAASP
jgi:hypothetical protein